MKKLSNYSSKILFILSILLILFKTITAQDNHTIDSLKQVIKTAKHDTTRINALFKLGEQLIFSNPDTTLIIEQQALSIADKNLTGFKNLSGLAALKDTLLKQKASALNNIGYIYMNQGDIPKALEYLNKSLNIQEEIGDKKGMATSFNNIGMIYNNQGDNPKALEYFNKSLNIYEEISDKKGMALSFNNIGSIYDKQASEAKSRQDFVVSDSLINKALEYYIKSFKMQEEIGNKKGMANSFNNIGAIYNNQGEAHPNPSQKEGLLNKALEYFNKSLNIREEIGDKEGMAGSFTNIGSLYFENNNIAKAKTELEKGYKLSKELGYPEIIEKCAGWLKKLYQKQGNYKLAYQYYQEEVLMHDSIQNEENYKKTMHQHARYEYEKKAATDSITHTKAMEIKDLDLKRQKAEGQRQRVIIYSFIVGFIIILVFSIVIFRLFMQKKKANLIIAKKNQSLEIAFTEISQQKEEITSQRDEIEAQRDKLSDQNHILYEQKKEITDSINYAKRIQQAILPDLALTTRGLTPLLVPDNMESTRGLIPLLTPETFVLFKPKDIVSGDFYWATKINDYLIYTVADCTGHGVPGAFMSMLGVSFLNEIVRKKEVTQASHVLDQLRISIIEALSQTGEAGTQKDGMDMSLVVIKNQDSSSKSQTPSSEQTSDVSTTSDVYDAQWSGANNPLWLVRSSKEMPPFQKVASLEEVKPNKQPVAIYEYMKPFTNHEIQLSKGDTIYLMSDGYEDQFGGEKFKKFMSKRLKEMLVTISEKSMTEQQKILALTFENWKGEHEQIDDVTLLGIRI